MKKLGIKTVLIAVAALVSMNAMATELKLANLKRHMEVLGSSYRIDYRHHTIGAFVSTFDRDLAQQICNSVPQGCNGMEVGRETHYVAVEGLWYDTAAEKIWFNGARGKVLCANVSHRHNFLGHYDVFAPTGACRFVTRRDVGVFFVVQD